MASVFTVTCILHGKIFIWEIFSVIESVLWTCCEDIEFKKLKREL